MVRNVDRESRRRAVLEATIRQYIQEAEPVASDDIAHNFDLSSATIRTIFSELEENGLLTHPHTSGGRIPTQRGYRYYVDFLLSQMELLDDEKQRILKEYHRKINRLEDALEETSEVISEITHYAGIVSFMEWQDRMFYKGISRILEHPEFKDAEKIRLLVRMIEDKRRLLEVINRDFSGKTKVYIGGELGCPEMQNCSLVVASFQVKNRPSGKLAVLGPVRMEYNHIIPALGYIADVLSEALEKL